MATEPDTCRALMTPKLQAAGWENEPHSIAGQGIFMQLDVAKGPPIHNTATSLKSSPNSVAPTNQLQSMPYAR